MNLTKRGKWLSGIAVLIAAYVVFGPKDSDSVEPTRPAARLAAHEAHRGAQMSAPVGHSLLALAHRVVEQTAAGALFATHSWLPPPPPPPAPAATAPAEPPAPVAPPLPFTYMGSYAPDGAQPVFFLTEGDRVYDVHVGDTLEGGKYSVDAFTNGALIFTYKPLNQQQQLTTGGAQ